MLLKLFLLFLLFALLTVLLLIIAIIFIVKGDQTKSAVSSFLASIFSAFIALFSLLSIEIPTPTIYPLDNETRTLSGNTEINIISGENDSFSTYYSVDGSDPKIGKIYKNPIIISESTTICARNKFLWMWSDITKSSYRYETIIYNNEMQLQEKSGDKVDSQEDKSNIPESIEELSNDNQINAEMETPISEPETKSKPTQESSTSQLNVSEGQNPSEGAALMTYINQYRMESGLNPLTWNSDLEQVAQNIVEVGATGKVTMDNIFCYPIARQCNGAKNAQKAVSDWITGNDYIPSEADILLSADFTQMGGALYYLPNGNEYGYHYFWAVCLQ